MRKVGNSASNKIYNSQGKKPSVPVDADEADSAMERFIRQKYTDGGFKTKKRNSHGSTVSDEGTPPPLPPKTPSKFGLKSASSFLSLGGRRRRRDKMALAPSSRNDAGNPLASPPPINKASRVFGAWIGYSIDDGLEEKMAKLRDMGFVDDQRNELILKGMHGNMEKAVEALVRLGEGGQSSSLPTTPHEPPRTSRSLTPMKPTDGLSLDPSRPATAQHDASSASGNPFDTIPPPAVQPLSLQSTSTLQKTTNPFFQPQPTLNPFGVPASQPQPSNLGLLTQSLQNLQLAPSERLFPHHTGGVPASTAASQLVPQRMTPPAQPTQNLPPVSFFNSNMSHPPAQPLQQHNTIHNPFLPAQNPQAGPSLSLALNTTGVQGAFGSNLFARSPTAIQSPLLTQIPEAAQQNVYYSPQSPPHALPSPTTNPFFAPPTSTPIPMPNQYIQQMQPQPQSLQNFPQQAMHQQPQRVDKASIMALFDETQAVSPNAAAAIQAADQTATSASGVSTGQQMQPKVYRTVSTPLPGQTNPFLTKGASAAATASITPRSEEPAGINRGLRQVSRDSMAFGVDMGWANGRHSPDAFASLSARAGR